MRLTDRLGHVQRLGELVVLALEGAVVVAPHLEADTDGFLEALEALAEWREGQAEPEVLLLVPGGADAEPGATPGEHVERADLLGEHAGMAVGDAGDEQPQPDG